MLKLVNITKTYVTGDMRQQALDGISISFRKNEFVSVLGQSGSGKTTLLNIIGGLDQYTSGDLVINGKSTKEYTDQDWDTYRNHSVGFVFQSYNLIPHQSVLRNVELALTLSGVSKAERRRRAVEALKSVGLEEHLHKRPNQLSGGQMQRVSIARALINDPDILLADEPTGALDSETSLQVMELLKEIAQDRLVVMVTHNPELAEKYSTRIVKLFDGRITSDSDPYEDTDKAPVITKKEQKRLRMEQKKRSMSYLTALSLSLNNLMTKKGRTFLTAFAGSIGIIGIALILSLSTGINNYIDDVQEETLSSYPITIEAETVDMSSLMSSIMGVRAEENEKPREDGRVYSSSILYDMLNSMVSAETTKNNLRAFKEYLDSSSEIEDLATVRYTYEFDFDVYSVDENGNVVRSDMASLLEEAMTALYGGNYSAYFDSMGSMYDMMSVWTELTPGEDGELISQSVKDQYDIVYGTWPENYDEVVLFVDQNNEISDMMLYALGLLPSEQMTEMLSAMQDAVQSGETPENEERSWSYEELCASSYKLILTSERYRKDTVNGGYVDLGETEAGLKLLYDSADVGTDLKVVGIARPNESGGLTTAAIGYTSALTQYAIETANATDVIQDQLSDPETDAVSGLPFPKEDDSEPEDEEKAEMIREYLSTQDAQLQAEAYLDILSQPSEEYVESMLSTQMQGMTRETIEDMIVERYASQIGVDASTIMSYIEAMSDDDLFSQVEVAAAEAIRQQYSEAVRAQLSSMSIDQLAGLLDSAMDPEGSAIPGVESLTTDQLAYLYDAYMPPTRSDTTYEDNIKKLGYVDLASPSSISIYAESFSGKDHIADLIAEYNEGVSNEDDEITYTDYIALLMSSITDIINAISYLLIGFVAISLVVSSIMIGVITYISVLERTKEIGILRAIGASKRDISRVFNAETLIVGLGAGLIGIGVTLLLIIPANAIIHRLTDIQTLSAVLPVGASVILVVISALLTIIAGLLPSKLAANKNPVEALRTE